MVLDRVGNGNRGIGSASTAGVNYRSKRIQASLSTQIVIQIEEEDSGKRWTIGGVQSMAYAQARPLLRIQEVGTDGTVGIVPQGATTHNLTINRMVFDFQRLPQALQRQYRHIHAQRRPFDIVVTDYNAYLGQEAPKEMNDIEPAGGGNRSVDTETGAVTGQTIETVFRNCWFENMNFTYDSANYTIVETATLQCEHVYDNQEVSVLSAIDDALERKTNTAQSASVMSAYDATLDE